MKEKWKWVVGFRGYYRVSSRGRIKSVSRVIECGGKRRLLKGKYLKPMVYPNTGGYAVVTLSKKGRPKCCQSHRLVLEAFVGPCPPRKECRHMDGNPTNNKLKNLKWGTPKQNANDKIRHGTYRVAHGETHVNAKINDNQVREIRHLYKTGKYTQLKLAKKFRVSSNLIWTIIHYRTRKDVI